MGTVRPVAEPLDPKARLGRVLRERWRVDELVWSTPASSLYWATHRTGTRAAIRVLAPELSANPVRAGHFLETAAIVQKIGHDGAVRILDDDKDQDGCVFLVLEIFDAVSLRAIMDAARDPMALEEAARIAIGILEVLAAAHRAGIAHGALRAEDVFVTRQNHVKLLGFEGRPESFDAGPNFQRDTSAVGSLLYTMLAAAPPRGHSLAVARQDLPGWFVDVVDRALGVGASTPWPDAGAMLGAILKAYRPPTPLEAFEPVSPLTAPPGASALSPGPTGFTDAPPAGPPSSSNSFIAFPVTDEMNPLFAQGGNSMRPTKRPSSPHTLRRKAAARADESRAIRTRRNRLAIGIAILAVGIVSVVLALVLRQL